MTNTREQADMTDTPITHPLSQRLRELSDAVTRGREAVAREFTMRVPAEPDRDADLVLSRAADELDRQQAALAAKDEALAEAAAELALLRAEAEALRADAERYRWLRLHLVNWCPDEDTARLSWHAREVLDAAIDAARAEGRSDD